MTKPLSQADRIVLAAAIEGRRRELQVLEAWLAEVPPDKRVTTRRPTVEAPAPAEVQDAAEELKEMRARLTKQRGMVRR